MQAYGSNRDGRRTLNLLGGHNRLGVQTSSPGLGSTLVRSRLGMQTSSQGLGSTLVRSRLGMRTPSQGLESTMVRSLLGVQTSSQALVSSWCAEVLWTIEQADGCVVVGENPMGENLGAKTPWAKTLGRKL